MTRLIVATIVVLWVTGVVLVARLAGVLTA
jgi:hypothetical protein